MSSFRVEVMNGPFAVNQFNVEAEHHFGAMRLALEAANDSPSEPCMDPNPSENYPKDAKSVQITVWEDPEMDEHIEKLERVKKAVDCALSCLKDGESLDSSYAANDLIAASNLLDDIANMI